jgi:hypothetical protein
MVLSGDVPSDFNLASFFVSPIFEFSTSGNGQWLFPEADRIGFITGRGGPPMEYFAGLDVSMCQTSSGWLDSSALLADAKGSSMPCR